MLKNITNLFGLFTVIKSFNVSNGQLRIGITMSSDTSPTVVYQNRLVALIDVMGFKKLLHPNEKSRELLQSFYDQSFEFFSAKGQNYAETAPDDDFKKIFVSDSIILSVVLTEDESKNLQVATRFFAAIALLQFLLAVKTKIWTRGAVSIGDLYIDEKTNVLVGPAFVSAYELEKKADYPRVIIDPKVCQFFDLVPAAFMRKINSLGYSNLLLGPNADNRLSGAPMNHNAIQIDWFRQTFTRSEIVSSFFKDLKIRISEDQTLFEKSIRLLEYLRESCISFECSTETKSTGNRKLEKIKGYLAEFS